MSDRPKSNTGKSIRPAKVRTSGRPPAAKKSLSIAPKKTAARRSVAPSGRKVILVVEDDAEVRGLVVRTLGTRYTVHEAPDGFAAAELLGTLKDVDLLLCDVMMPRVDGFSLAAMLKNDEKLKSVPLIFLTARSAPADILKGINIGARHYLSKPFSMKDLLEKVAKLLE